MAKRKLKLTYVKQTTYKKYEKAQAVLANSRYIQTKDQFLAKFSLCEIVCKSVVEAFKKVQQQECADIKDIKLDMRTIPHAFAKFNYNIDKHILTEIFGKNEKRGQKTAKKLRNGIIHALSEDDIIEVISRRDELFSAMDSFLDGIIEGQSQESIIQEDTANEKELILV